MQNFTILLLLLGLIYFTPSAEAQNLVPNGSFEQYKSCPGDLSQLDYCVNWFSPAPDTVSTPDYFTTCYEHVICGVPENYFGFQKAYDGSAYAGLYLYYHKDDNYREYIEVQLDTILEANSCYNFSMYISLADKSLANAYSIGALFLDTAVKNLPNAFPIHMKPQVFNDSKIFPDTSGWRKIEGTFKAKGGERFLIIGNFNYDHETTVKKLMKNQMPKVYVYIDYISLYLCNKRTSIGN
jgi:OOP family OmpA-OmpF porin